MNKSKRQSLLVALDRALQQEREAFIAMERDGTKKYKQAQVKILEEIKAARKSGDVGTILGLEKAILENECHYYGQSKREKTKWVRPLERLAVIEKLFDSVRNAKTYAKIAELFTRRIRIRGVPKDAAHHSFKDLDDNLSNKLLRTRILEEEIATLEARRENLRIAAKEYIALQRRAIGLPPVS